jgi:glycosyltransferase involved in cell wall biosynthesis
LRQKTTVWARTLPPARELVSRNWRVAILIPPWDSPADAGRAWNDGGVELVNVEITGGVPATVQRLLREVAARSPDIVHIVKPRAHAGLLQWWLTQRRRLGGEHTPLVLDIDDWEQAWAPINGYSWPLARFLAWQEEWGIRHADAITAASGWLIKRANEYAPRTPLLYLPNGIDPQASAAPQPNPSGCVLFFTRFVEVEPQWLAQFAASLYAIRPQTHLVIAGTPVRQGLDLPFRQAVAASAAAGVVEWRGYVQGADLPALYAATGCAIFPAADVPLQQAKCSVRLATTLLQGVPVVASAVGEQARYGADGAARLLSPDATPSEFAATVDEVLRHPQQQVELAQAAARRLLERYAWPRLGQSLSDFYTNLLA